MGMYYRYCYKYASFESNFTKLLTPKSSQSILIDIYITATFLEPQRTSDTKVSKDAIPKAVL